jgi:hypothetical protein
MPSLEAIPQISVYAAMAAWTLTFGGLVVELAGRLRSRGRG